jgi:hypothetical protein
MSTGNSSLMLKKKPTYKSSTTTLFIDTDTIIVQELKMKTRFLSLLTALALAGFSSTALAVQVSVEDVSKQIFTCDHSNPFLSQTPPGTCLGSPDATLRITVTLDPNANPNVLDNVHVVVQSNGENFQYNTRSDGTTEGSKRWKKISVNGLVGASPLVSSYQRGPWDTDKSSITRDVTLDEFYSRKGTKVYVGVRANDTAGFAADSIKEAYEVR